MGNYWSSNKNKDNPTQSVPEIPDPSEKHIEIYQHRCSFANCSTTPSSVEFYKSRKDNKYANLENSLSLNKNKNI